MGSDKNKDSDGHILFADKEVAAITIMNSLSKAFTHCYEGAGIKKDIG